VYRLEEADGDFTQGNFAESLSSLQIVDLIRRMSPFAFDVLLGMKLGIFGHPVVSCAPSTVWIILFLPLIRGTQREYSSKPLKHSIVKRVLVFKL